MIVFKDKNFAGYLPVYQYSLFMVVSTAVENRGLFMEVYAQLKATSRDIFS
jgi:hypothetical protein